MRLLIFRQRFDQGFTEICEGAWIWAISLPKKLIKILSGVQWGSQDIGQRRLLNLSMEALTLDGVSHTGMEPAICPKRLVMSAVCLLGVMGWREVGRGIIHRGNKHEFNPRAVKKMSFKVWTPLQVSRSYSMLSLNVAGRWYLAKGTFSLTQIPWQWLYQSTLQKRM